MRLLLDTNILLWALLRPARLDGATLEMIEDEQNAVQFSIASIWEIAIRSRLGRDGFNARPSDVHRFATEDMIRSGTLDYGDPPNIGCGNASMSSVAQAAFQYWSRPRVSDWRRDHELEIKIRLPWMDADDDGLVQRSTSPVNSECAPPYDPTPR